MMLQLFSNLHKYYKEGVVPRYFIPEVNLLDEYLETFKEVFFAELKTLEDLQSLPSTIKPATLLKLMLLYGCFSHFLNCTNSTKLRNAPHLPV